jgi:hypothetical protein
MIDQFGAFLDEVEDVGDFPFLGVENWHINIFPKEGKGRVYEHAVLVGDLGVGRPVDFTQHHPALVVDFGQLLKYGCEDFTMLAPTCKLMLRRRVKVDKCEVVRLY